MATYLFAYGTLRQGLNSPVNDFFKRHTSWHGKGYMPGYLFDLGDYPGAVFVPESPQQVWGDIFLISDEEELLPMLDEYEGCGAQVAQEEREYDRIVAPIVTEDEKLRCWVYHYRLSTQDLKRIPHGDFLKYMEELES